MTCAERTTGEKRVVRTRYGRTHLSLLVPHSHTIRHCTMHLYESTQKKASATLFLSILIYELWFKTLWFGIMFNTYNSTSHYSFNIHRENNNNNECIVVHQYINVKSIDEGYKMH